MELENALKSLTTSIQKQSPQIKTSSPNWKQYLESRGFLESVAGNDFAKIVRGLEEARTKVKGLMLTGACGTGKTMLMKILRKDARVETQWVNCSEDTSIDFLLPEYNSMINEWYHSNIFLDDLGADTIRNEYGVKKDVVGSFIEKYHRRGGTKLFITTNLSSKQLIEKYGARIFDRLLEMCVVVSLEGKSKREQIIIR